MLLTLLSVVYVVCAILLSLYALGAFVLLIAYWRHRHEQITTPRVRQWPTVAVQLPIYNERFVVERLLTAVSRLDYPHDRLFIQVLDDSTDETSTLVARQVKALKRRGLNIEHVRRENRTGYKAGALAYGLEQLDVEYVAVLDADFVPPRQFLRNTIPHLVHNQDLGMVQGRWGHLNQSGNLLTRGQALALDGHFVVEQMGRNRSGWLINFNGSGGVWRVKAIEDAGGWRDNTLTEDLDLSYRAQLKGWQFLYLPNVVVPGELPPQLIAYKQQQARWAKGGTQCMAILMGPIWRTRGLRLSQRIMGMMHLCQYLNAPIMILLLLLTPPLLLSGAIGKMPLGPLGIAGLGPPLVYAISQRALYPDWGRRFLMFPTLMIMGTGLSLNNTRAVLAGLLAKRGEFKRTPKVTVTGLATTTYRLGADKLILFEAALAVYSLWGTTLALQKFPTLVPYLVIYSLAFGVFALWGLYEALHVRTQRPAQALG